MKLSLSHLHPAVLLTPLALLALAASLVQPAKTQTALPVASQWAASGANIYNTNTGNVGVGTNAPGAKLHVNGGAIRLQLGTKNWELAYDAINGYFYVDEFGVARQFVIKNGGNVGLGVTNPGAKLDVAGTARMTGFTLTGNGAAAGRVLTTDASGNGTWQAATTYAAGAGLSLTGNTFSIANNAVTSAMLSPDSASLSKVSGIVLSSDGNNIGLNDRNFYLRGVTDTNHGLGWFGAGKQFAATNVDGPVLFGFSGGALGTNQNGTQNIALNWNSSGNVGIGNTNPQQKLDVSGWVRCHAVQITGGSDLAEPFDVRETAEARPGMVLCIDPEQTGKLRLAAKAYDRAVAGVVSGANGVQPGLTLAQKGNPDADGKHPVALTGRVWVYVDADAGGSVAPGDLLTTSDTPGHAMKVTDFARANGCILGKAMSSLKSGKGLVLVLVGLQ